MAHLFVNFRFHSVDLLEDVVQHNKANHGDCATLTLVEHFCLSVSRVIAVHCLTLTFSTTRRTVESPKCPFVRGPPAAGNSAGLVSPPHQSLVMVVAIWMDNQLPQQLNFSRFSEQCSLPSVCLVTPASC